MSMKVSVLSQQSAFGRPKQVVGSSHHLGAKAEVDGRDVLRLSYL